MKTHEEGYWVSKETGETMEVPEGATIRIKEETDRIKNVMERKEQNTELAEVKKNVCGDFIWSLYGMGDKYYPDIADHMLAKIVYLLTYLDYDRNILVVRDSVTSTYRPMKKADVKNIIRLHRCNFDAFWKQLLETGIISENKKGELVVSPYFCKGTIRGKDKKNMAAMKIFTHSVRYMYENIDVRSHRYLAYLYRLIPFISLKYNIFCKNPLENNHTMLDKMTAKDMCQLLGMDEHNQKRLIDTLFKLTFVDKNGDKRSVITVVTNYKNDEKRNFILINPQFYSGYIQEEDLIGAMNEFMLDKE